MRKSEKKGPNSWNPSNPNWAKTESLLFLSSKNCLQAQCGNTQLSTAAFVERSENFPQQRAPLWFAPQQHYFLHFIWNVHHIYLCVHIAVSLKEKDDSLQTFIEHVQYTNNIKNIIFHLSTTHQTSFSYDCVTIARISFMKHLAYVIIDKKII